MKVYIKLTVILTLVILSLPASAQQPVEVKTMIEAGWTAYVAKDYIAAAEKFEEAANTMRSMRVATLKPFLPQAPEGWAMQKEEKSEAAGIGGAMFGGMSVLSRKFTKGAENVEVNIMTDSPLFTALLAMIKVMPAGSEQEQGIEKYKGYYAQYKVEDDKNNFSVFDESGVVVSVEGKALSKESAMLFADKIDFAGLVKAVKK